jgi:hypothetical protein
MIDKRTVTEARRLSKDIADLYHATRDPDTMAKAMHYARLDHEASYMPGTGTNNGGRGSDISDPTHNAAQRPHPNQHHHIAELAQTIRSKGHWYIGYLNLIASPAATRAHTSPCNNGVYHQPDDNHNCTAPGCGKRWPTCSPDHTAGRYEECTGHIDPDHGRCTRCELSRGSWTCRSCLEIKAPDDKQRRHMCNTCYQADYRSRVTGLQANNPPTSRANDRSLAQPEQTC